MKPFRLASLISCLALLLACSTRAEVWELWNQQENRCVLRVLGERLNLERPGCTWRLLEEGRNRPLERADGLIALPRGLNWGEVQSYMSADEGSEPPSIESLLTYGRHAPAPFSSYTSPEHLSRARSSDRVNVNGYFRKNGTYVRPHTRSRPH